MVDKIVSRSELMAVREDLRKLGLRVVFTNGCFDLIHRGHVEMLVEARSFGDALIVGLNSDEGVRALKVRIVPCSAKKIGRYYCLLLNVSHIFAFLTKRVSNL